MMRIRWLQLLVLSAWSLSGGTIAGEQSALESGVFENLRSHSEVPVEIPSFTGIDATGSGFPYGETSLTPPGLPAAIHDRVYLPGTEVGEHPDAYQNSFWDPLGTIGLPMLLAVLGICLLGCFEHREGRHRA